MGSKGTGKAGDYWEKVQVWKKTTEKDPDTGFDRPVWTLFKTCWCFTTDVKADKKIAYGIENSMTETEIHIRGYPEIDAKDRFLVMTTGFYHEPKGIKYDYSAGETVVVAIKIPSLGTPA